MSGKPFSETLSWYLENAAEYQALNAAWEGDMHPLAEHVERIGVLATHEARAFVAARLRGDKQPRGLKATTAQNLKRLGLLQILADIQDDLDCSEYEARKVFLDANPDYNAETFKTDIRRAKKFIEELTGQKPESGIFREKSSEKRIL
jgi:hypothetical protein